MEASISPLVTPNVGADKLLDLRKGHQVRFRNEVPRYMMMVHLGFVRRGEHGQAS